MRIRKLEIENYRQHRDISLDLNAGSSDFIILKGSNGAGKTNLLNAIIWCLYGREDYYSRDMEASPLVSQSAIQEAADGDLISCCVTLELVFANGAEARITRTQDFQKSGNGATPQAVRLQAVVMESEEKGHRSVANPEHWIERWVPSRLEPYFLFDGERLDNFFKHAEEQKVRDAVLQIAQIDLLARMVDHLEKTSNKLFQKVAAERGGEDGDLLAKQLKDRRSRLDAIDKESASKRDAISEYEATSRMLESKIGDIAAVVKDVARRKELQDQLGQIDTNLRDSWNELFLWSARMAPTLLAADALDGLQGEIDAARKARRLPPPVAPSILERLLKQATCVCGRGLEDGSDARRHIEELLAEYAAVGELGSVLLELEPHVRKMAGRLDETESVALNIMRRVSDWEKRNRSVSEELEVLEARLAGHEDSKVAQLQGELTKAKEALAKANRELARLEIEAENVRAEILGIEKTLEKMAGQQARVRELLQQTQFARHCLSVAQGIYDDLSNEVRTTVASTLDSQFKKMIWKKDFVDAVSIDENYRVSVRNMLGFEILPDLSAGERECLAFAFSLALSDVAGYELPMVVDTPLGIMSPEVQQNVAHVLAESTKPSEKDDGHQLIMLMTETEYNDEVAKVVSYRKPRVFEISFDTQRAVSSLVEVS